MREYTAYERFYKTAAWKNCRAAYISKRQSIDGGLCERCRQKLGANVHHKKYITEENMNDAAVTLNHDNLELLCIDCHNDEHGRSATTRCRFDENGQPYPLSEN